MHDASKVLLGQVPNSDKGVSCEPADPTSFPAGLAVCRKSDGGLSLAQSDGEPMGISLGASLSDHKKTAVCRLGNNVPIRVRPILAFLAGDELIFTAKDYTVAGEDVSIELLDTGTGNVAVVTVVGKKISVSIEEGVSTATKIKTELDASAAAAALITTTIVDGQGAAFPDAFAEENLDDYSDAFVALGAIVYIDDETGEACKSDQANAQATSAYYQTGILTGYDPILAASYPCAKIDLGGGL
jgi:hypothetical protein